MNEEQKKPNKKAVILIMIITALILAVCCVWTAFVMRKPAGQRVFIIQDNQVIQEIYLDEAKNQEFQIPSADGGYNLVRIENHVISIAEADCPDQTCVRTGVLRSEGLPIVCLPHKLIIRFAEEGETS